MKTVAIVQRRMTHYRLPLFERMRAELLARGIRLRVLHGEPTLAEASKDDRGTLDWAEHLPTRYFAGGRILWQPFMGRVHDADLVILPQENKHLHNLPALFNPWRHRRLAFWGHGRNMQSDNPDSLLERLKRHSVCRVDWWFAYTEISAACVRDAGFRPRTSRCSTTASIRRRCSTTWRQCAGPSLVGTRLDWAWGKALWAPSSARCTQTSESTS